MSSGGGGEGEGEGACESNVADSVARAPKRRRGGAEASGGGSVPGEGEGLRQPHAAAREVTPRMGRSVEVLDRIRC